MFFEFKKISVIVCCDVVNVQPRFNFSDEIIVLNLESGMALFSLPITNVTDNFRLYA